MGISNNYIMMRSDKELQKILNKIIAYEMKKGNRISIQKATRMLAKKLEGRVDELLEKDFIEF